MCPNAYSGGLSLSVLLGQDEKKSQLTTAISGIIGTVLAAVGILNSIQGFLSLLSAIVPALIGTMVADYWIIGKGKSEHFRERKGFYAPGLISFLLGALVACVTGGTFASVPGLAALNIPFFIGAHQRHCDRHGSLYHSGKNHRKREIRLQSAGAANRPGRLRPWK